MSKNYNLPSGGGYLLIRGDSSFILVGKTGRQIAVCIEDPGGEYCQGLSEGDLVAVSAPEGGDTVPAIMLVEMVRSYGLPLIVLPKGHPGSRRLRYIVSAGESIRMSCSIERGTHPEQDILCSSGEFLGMVLKSVPGRVCISAAGNSFRVSQIDRISIPIRERVLE